VFTGEFSEEVQLIECRQETNFGTSQEMKKKEEIWIE
ncbi:MAG: hypothetical protein ACI90V_000247, partial [Bacillariaceae sp.]|jgi:hypothetical protein